MANVISIFVTAGRTFDLRNSTYIKKFTTQQKVTPPISTSFFIHSKVSKVSETRSGLNVTLLSQNKVTTTTLLTLLIIVNVAKKTCTSSGICPFNNFKIVKVKVTLAVTGTVIFCILGVER